MPDRRRGGAAAGGAEAVWLYAENALFAMGPPSESYQRLFGQLHERAARDGMDLGEPRLGNITVSRFPERTHLPDEFFTLVEGTSTIGETRPCVAVGIYWSDDNGLTFAEQCRFSV